MEIGTLTNLKKYNGLYDLYSSINIDNKAYNLYEFNVSDKHNMRLDLVCFDIYQNTDHVDTLTILNGIINVFSVYSGDTIYFLDENAIETAKSSESITNQIVNSIKGANTGKTHKQDNNRTKDVNARKQIEKDKQYIPHNILQSNSNFDNNNGVITIKPNF